MQLLFLSLQAHRNDYLKFPTWWFLHVTEKESTITEEIREILRNNVTFITITFPLNDANNTKYVRHIQVRQLITSKKRAIFVTHAVRANFHWDPELYFTTVREKPQLCLPFNGRKAVVTDGHKKLPARKTPLSTRKKKCVQNQGYSIGGPRNTADWPA